MRILILGGTAEARALAAALAAAGHAVTTSLAGRTSDPAPVAGTVRSGPFGGAEGLAAYLVAEAIERLVDATHPYAATISANAVAAAEQSGVPLLRLLRPQWEEPAGAGWLHVTDMAAAASALPAGAVVLVTTGHAGLAPLLARRDCQLVVRLIEPPTAALPGHARLLLARPPYDLAAEIALLRSAGITHLVSKNSGGTQIAAKLEAARATGAQIVMIDRPPYPPAPQVDSVAAALAALAG